MTTRRLIASGLLGAGCLVVAAGAMADGFFYAPGMHCKTTLSGKTCSDGSGTEWQGNVDAFSGQWRMESSRGGVITGIQKASGIYYFEDQDGHVFTGTQEAISGVYHFVDQTGETISWCVKQLTGMICRATRDEL